MADTTLENGNPPPVLEKDEEELAEFGYKQELKRDWGLTHNFGISFSIIVCFLPSSSSPLDSQTKSSG